MEKRIFGIAVSVGVLVWTVVSQDYILKNMYSDEGHLLAEYGPPLI